MKEDLSSENSAKKLSIEFFNNFIVGVKKNVSFFSALRAIFKSGKLFVAVLGVILAMLVLSIFIYHHLYSFVTVKTLDFFEIAPAAEGIISEIYHALKVFGAFLFKLVIKVFLFYLSFILSYSLVSPLYSFISTLAENVYFGKPEDDAEISLSGVWEDIKQSVKITFMLLFLEIVFLLTGFIPLLGQICGIVLTVLMNSLLMFDFVMSRRRWSLPRKVKWLFSHPFQALHVAVIPAAVSWIPVVNSIFMAFLFPVFVVQATMNFAYVQGKGSLKKSGERSED